MSFEPHSPTSAPSSPSDGYASPTDPETTPNNQSPELTEISEKLAHATINEQTAASPMLSSDTFQNIASQLLSDAFDEMRSAGLAREFDLPELVLLGDQSSGKSSLLQSLTDIPFPVGHGACTRFPLRIVSRRTPDVPEQTIISIQTDETKERSDNAPDQIFEGFPRIVANMTESTFQDILKEVETKLGINSSEKPTGTDPSAPGLRRSKQPDAPTYSKNVLKIEISGPGRSPFSMLDVPGVFHSVVDKVTEAEKEVVLELVSYYMEAPRSVIICVTDGCNDLSNQAAYGMAQNVDPSGDRTVGVITKCDVTQNFESVFERTRGFKSPLRHGWFAVRNRTPEEVAKKMSSQERQVEETNFFSKPPWNQMNESNRGTQKLKDFLADLLCKRNQQVFPIIMKDIGSRKKSDQIQLDGLGSSRQTFEQKRNYLVDLAESIHSTATQVFEGEYGGVEKKDVKLRMLIREENKKFGIDMKENGRTYPFIQIKDVGWDALPKANDEPVIQARPISPIIFQPTLVRGCGLFQTIAFREPEHDLSFEELRLRETFQVSRSNPSSTTSVPASSAESIFSGAQHQPQTSSSYFGSTANAQAPTSSNLFGSTANAQAPASNNLFGSTANARPPASSNFFGSTANSQPQGSFSFGTNPTADHQQQASLSPQPTASSGRRSASASRAAKPTGETAEKRKPAPTTAPSKAIYDEIISAIQENTGTELPGTLNPSVLPKLFRQQAEKWKPLSKKHVERVFDIVTDVMEEIIDQHCENDEMVKQKLKAETYAMVSQSELKAEEELARILKSVFAKSLATDDTDFGDKIKAARLRRFKAAFSRFRSRHIKTEPGANASNNISIGPEHLGLLFMELHISNEENLKDEIHDLLEAYYELERVKFVENINKLVIENCLLEDSSPVLFMSPKFVYSLSEDKINHLAAEDPDVVNKRKALTASLGRLEKAEKIAEGFT